MLSTNLVLYDSKGTLNGSGKFPELVENSQRLKVLQGINLIQQGEKQIKTGVDGYEVKLEKKFGRNDKGGNMLWAATWIRAAPGNENGHAYCWPTSSRRISVRNDSVKKRADKYLETFERTKFLKSKIFFEKASVNLPRFLFLR